jgi:hypothetical protein
MNEEKKRLDEEFRLSTRFKDHVATYWCEEKSLGRRVERLTFRNISGSGNDYIEYLSIGSALIVRGDLYEAIYAVSGEKSLSWWEGTDPDYLSGKMRDLNGGRALSSETWDSDQADRELEKFKQDLIKNLREETTSQYESYKTDSEENENVSYENWLEEHLDGLNEFDDKQRKSYSHTYAFRMKFWNEYEPERHTSDEHEWITFLHEHGEELFGDCHYETGCYDFGKRRHPMIDVHKHALDLALKQLREKGVVLYAVKE